jgi:hypothetical protein
VEPNAEAYLGDARNVRSDERAYSSGAALVIKSAARVPGFGLAPDKLAISPIVKPADCSKNSGVVVLGKWSDERANLTFLPLSDWSAALPCSRRLELSDLVLTL